MTSNTEHISQISQKLICDMCTMPKFMQKDKKTCAKHVEHCPHSYAILQTEKMRDKLQVLTFKLGVNNERTMDKRLESADQRL